MNKPGQADRDKVMKRILIFKEPAWVKCQKCGTEVSWLSKSGLCLECDKPAEHKSGEEVVDWTISANTEVIDE